MGGYGWQVVLVVVLVLLNAAFSGSEMALISLRESQLQRLERQSRTGRTLAKLARDPNRFLATIQIGITLAGFLASAAAATTLAQPLIEPLSGFLGTKLDVARPAEGRLHDGDVGPGYLGEFGAAAAAQLEVARVEQPPSLALYQRLR